MTTFLQLAGMALAIAGGIALAALYDGRLIGLIGLVGGLIVLGLGVVVHKIELLTIAVRSRQEKPG